MKRFIVIFLILFDLSFGQDFFTEFQKAVLNSNGFESQIIQKTYQAGFSNPDLFTGEVKASKPLTLKIEYKKPYQQIIFMNKEKVILYNKEQNQAVITSPKNSLLITDIISIFVDNKPIDKVFKVIQTKEINKTVILDLKPKNYDDIKSLQLIVEQETFKPKKVVAVDTDENKIEIEFENFKYFKNMVNIDFKLPQNVEIVKQ